MATRKKKPKSPKSVKTLTHAEEKRKNIPTAEYQSMVEKGNTDPLTIAYERRNPDLDPQLVWRGKDVRDGSDRVVIFITNGGSHRKGAFNRLAPPERSPPTKPPPPCPLRPAWKLGAVEPLH